MGSRWSCGWVATVCALVAVGGCSSDTASVSSSVSSSVATTVASVAASAPSGSDAPGVTLPLGPAVCPRLRDAALLLVPEIAERELPESPLTATDFSHTADTIECRAPFAVDEQGNPFGNAQLTVASLTAILAETKATDLAGAISSSGYRCVPSATPVGEYTTVLFCDTPDVKDTPSVAMAVGAGTLAAFYVAGAEGKATLPTDDQLARAMAVILGVA